MGASLPQQFCSKKPCAKMIGMSLSMPEVKAVREPEADLKSPHADSNSWPSLPSTSVPSVASNRAAAKEPIMIRSPNLMRRSLPHDRKPGPHGKEPGPLQLLVELCNVGD